MYAPDLTGALLNVKHPEHWRLAANCDGIDVGVFFPTMTDREPEAVRDFCQPCPVRRECLVAELQAAPNVGAQLGVRGLTSADRRRLIKYLRANELEPYHLTLADIHTHDTTRQMELAL